MSMAYDAQQDSDGVGTPTTDTMLTTLDNPWSPFTHFDEWYSWDTSHGYHTSALLARITVTSDEISETDQSLALDLAMQEIARINASGMHKLVSQSESVNES